MDGHWSARFGLCLSFLLGATGALAACGGDDDGDGKDPGQEQHPTFHATFASRSCPFELPEGAKVQCGTLTVPENYAQPKGKTIALAVARYQSTSATPARDPLVYLSGGPGGGGLDEVASFFSSFQPTLEQRDVIAIDQRGTGYSEPVLDCPELDGADEEADGLKALVRCKERLIDAGVDPAQYNTLNNARDLKALREALKIAQWNPLGTSYGTRLVLEMMRIDAAGTRSAILDSTLPPDVDNLAETPLALQESLEAVFDACAKSAACSADNPNLEARFFALLEQLNQEPVQLELESSSLTVSGDDLAGLMHSMLYDAEAATYLPQIVSSLESGDTGLLTFLMEAAGGEGGDDGMALAMYLSVICAEWAPLTTLEKVAQAAEKVHPELVAALDVPTLLKACQVWDVPAAGPAEFEPIESAIPTLVLSGAIDPATPPRWGKHAAETLSQVHYSLFQSMSHGVITSDCGARFAADFVAKPSAVEDPVCDAHDLPLFAAGADSLNEKSRAPVLPRLRHRRPLPWQR
jgi:pimeloyl-ACP methyl ester carboxylesterase